MSASKLDAVYRSILITKFFTKGWGKPDNLKRIFEFRKVISNRDECYKLIPPDYQVTITKEEKRSDCHLLEGHFVTPLEPLLPGVVPECAKLAHFQVVMPTNWPQTDYKPMCVHLAGTGDHFFWRRRNLMAKPLLKEGIGSIILENPFYGLRKPDDQVRSSLHNVSDIFVMGGCLILETLVLFHWCQRNGLGPLGVTGLSMGGHMASLAATNWPQPIVLVPCLSWSTASAVFTQGVMSNSINWELLENQFFSDGVYKEQLAKMVTVIDDAFLAGRNFAQRFSRKNENPQQITALTLPKMITATNDNFKTFDITNPNSLLQCQGILPDCVKKYSNSNNALLPRDVNGVKTAVEMYETSRTSHKISENLYKKITSKEKFTLEQSEINELNELAFKTVESKLENSSKISQNSDKTVSNASQIDDKPFSENNDKIISMNNGDEIFSNTSQIDDKTFSNNSNDKTISIVELCDSDCSNKTVVDGVDSNNVNTSAVKSENVPTDSVPQEIMLRQPDKNSLVEVSKKDSIMNVLDGRVALDGISSMAVRLLSGFPFIAKSPTNEKQRYREALQFMRGVMDECTHLGNFSVPYDTSLIIAVCAKHDAYVPRSGCGTLEELWPGAEVRYIDAGHVSAYVLHQKLFRSCIVEAFERSKKNWKDGEHILQ